MASRTAQKSSTPSKNGGPPKRPKAGSVSQREAINRLADEIMAIDSTINQIEVEMVKQGHTKTDEATVNGQAVMDVDGETQATYASWEGRQKELLTNLECGYPILMPLARKQVRKRRAEQDAQKD